MKISKDVPVMKSYDLVVCGGGCAGWIAAVTAARLGLSTALVERFGFFGGMATAGLVLPVSGYYLNGKQTVGGIPMEFAERMERQGGAKWEMPKGNLSFDPELYKLVAEEMLTEAGVDCYPNTVVSSCDVQEGRIRAVILETARGTAALTAGCVIDATGNADVAGMAGVEMLADPDELQPMSLCFLLGGVDATTDLLRDCIHHDGKHGASVCGKLHDDLTEFSKTGAISGFGGPWFNVTLCGDVLAVNVTRRGADARDPDALRDAGFAMRREMFTIMEHWKKTYPEFARARILSSAPAVGVRETNHIKGVYTLTGGDVLAGRIFPDSVALCAHPIDIHRASGGEQSLTRLTKPAGIPFGTMISPECENLICTGRTISADREAYASVRVQATGMALGQAAGCAAKLYGRSGGAVCDLPRAELVALIRKIGGITE